MPVKEIVPPPIKTGIRDLDTNSNLMNEALREIYRNLKTVAITTQPHIADADGTLADITLKFNRLLDALEANNILKKS